MSALQYVAVARTEVSSAKAKPSRPHLMWCPWKQQKIVTMNVLHLCGSLKCVFNVFHNFLKSNCGLGKPIGSRENTGTSPALFSPLRSRYSQSLSSLAASLGVIIPLANQYLSNQRFSSRLGWTALLNPSIHTVICTADGIQNDSSGKKSADR